MPCNHPLSPLSLLRPAAAYSLVQCALAANWAALLLLFPHCAAHHAATTHWQRVARSAARSQQWGVLRSMLLSLAENGMAHGEENC